MTTHSFVLLRTADRVPTRWTNNGGVTRQIDAGPGWRLSIADIDASGPFSQFPDAVRVLTTVDGPAATLRVDGRTVSVPPLTPVIFDGEAATAIEVAAPTTALNLILTGATGSVSVISASGEDPALVGAGADTVFVLALQDRVECDLPGDALLLQRFDAVRFSGGADAIVTAPGGGLVAVIRIAAPSPD